MQMDWIECSREMPVERPAHDDGRSCQRHLSEPFEFRLAYPLDVFELVSPFDYP